MKLLLVYSMAHNSGHKGTFSRQDGNAKEDVDCNMNIYFS